MASGGGAQIPVRGKGSDQCPDHQRSVMFYCVDDGNLVCDRCVTLNHQGHKLQSLEVIASEKKTKIQEYHDTIEREQIPMVESSLESVEDKINTNSKNFETLVETIKNRSEKLKKEIDKITEILIKQCKADEKHNQKVLSQQEKELNSLLMKLNDKLNKCKEKMKSDNHVRVIDDDLDIEFIVPSFPELKYLTFVEGQIPTVQLQDGIGCLYRANDSNIVSEFECPFSISVVKSTPDSLWLFNFEEQNLLLVSLQGEIKQTIEVEFQIVCLTVSPSTGNLWIGCGDKTVKEWSGSKFTTRFTTDEKYFSLVYHTSGDSLIMAAQGKVTLFSMTGQVLQTTQSSDSHLFVAPLHISVCNTTGDIAITDIDLSDTGGNDKPHVIMLDSTLSLKYNYDGPSALQCSFIDTKECIFVDAVYDFQGYLLVSDTGNSCIHVVSHEGQFLTLLYVDQQNCACLTLMEENLLCVGFEDKIKQIKYSINSAI